MELFKTDRIRVILSVFLTALGIFIFFTFITELFLEGYINFHTVNNEKAGQTGDFIGGIVGSIFTLVGIVLLYETLSLQRQEFIESRKVFQKQQFENKYFSLLELYNNIVNSFRLEIIPHTFRGKDFFTKNKEMLLHKYVSSNSYFKNRKQAIAFYNNFYLANRESLGQYFRTLYRIFELIETNITNEKEKVSYVKIIRGQLSESELFFINYNACTTFGEKFRNYILNYNLVKHLPILERLEFTEFKRKLTEEKSNAVSLVFEQVNDFLKSKNNLFYKTYLKGRFAFKVQRTTKKISIEIFRNNNVNYSNYLQEGFGLDDLTNEDFEKLLKGWFLEFFYFRKYIDTNNSNLKFKVDILVLGNKKFKITCNIYNADNSDLLF